MADDTSASIITLHQPRPKKTTKTPAERAREYRQRKKAEKSVTVPDLPVPASVPATVSTPVTPLPPPTVALRAITPSRRSAAPLLLTVAALVMPSCAAGLWQAGQRTTALAAWAVWLMTFVFAVTAGIGFASVNIADVTMARASRATPAVATAQAALNDAMAARDRECKGGVGKFCRERETAVTERRQAVDVAMRAVEQTADPQTEAAIRIVAWTSLGTLRPTADDFAMLRLVLLALLPQIGGILLMVGRVHRC